MSRNIFFRKTLVRNFGFFTIFITCVIFIATSRMGGMDEVCLQKRRLRSSREVTSRSGEPLKEEENTGYDKNNSAENVLYPTQESVFELKQEIEELKRKLEIYERVNSFTELDSVGKYGSKARQNIFLVSDMRAGSSFLGEMFNQHPQVFYLYEPVQALDYYRENRQESVYDTMVTHLLNGIFHCNFRELSYLTDFLSFQYSSLKHRLASKALSSPPLCPENFNSPSYSIRTCTPLRTQTVSAICRLHRHTVVKTVQMKQIHKLSYLMDSEGPADYSLKVVHLVRDPRAILNSRVTKDARINWTVASVKEHARGLCRDMLRNIKYAVSAPPWLEGSYTLLRYEDLATNPHQIAEQLYKFVGINIAPQVRMWIDRATAEGFTSVTLDNSVSRLVSPSAQNITDSVHKWRLQIPYSIVTMIETECYEVMNLLGYKIVDDEEELRTVSFPLRE